MAKVPLRESHRTDLKDLPEIRNDLVNFSFDYFYNGHRLGNIKSGIIDLFVVSWIMDEAENIFIRYCKYSGHKEKWKVIIKNQIHNHMQDIGISEGITNAQLRFFEVENDKYLKTESFEKKFLEIKASMKTNL